MKSYDHKKIEPRLLKQWATKKVYATKPAGKQKKHYVLDMFPYPSGAGLHVGHPRGYIGSDVYARMKRMQGFNVLHPMGFDAFGLPAEQYAIQTGKHPSIITRSSIKNFKSQLEKIGFSYDWSREVQTIDPSYYKWTQWIFLKIYNSFFDTVKQKALPIDELVAIFGKSGNAKVNNTTWHSEVGIFTAKEWKAFSAKEKQDILMKYRMAYEGYAEVNWCKELGTVLANDEVVDKDGKLVSERGEFPVEKKSMRQWFMRISAYGDRLVDGLRDVDFSESTKEVQRNWIGKSEGSEIEFKLEIGGNSKSSESKKLLIGTRNMAKVEMVKACLPKLDGYEILSLNDVDVDDSTLVEGDDYIENAKMKARFYFEKTGIPTISTDNIFWTEKWHKDDGVIVHMRKEVNPKSARATDQEVLDYLVRWAKKVGGKSRSHFMYALAYADMQGVEAFAETGRDYFLQSKPSGRFLAGYPTESLLVDAKTKQYKGDQKMSVAYDTLISQCKAKLPQWIGRDIKVKVFTTRADTLFGVTYVVLAPEHALVSSLKSQVTNKKEVEKFLETVKNKTQEERTDAKEKSGVALEGVYAVNPANEERVPVWIADYVLAGYGTGAVMAVPAHDERDFEFAKKYDMPNKQVILPQFFDTKNPPVKGKKHTVRDTVHVILRDPKNETILVQFLRGEKWKGNEPVNFIIGGIEEGESEIETGIREIREETGYIHVAYAEKIPFDSQANFFAAHKDVNRSIHVRTLIFDLLDEEKIDIEEDEYFTKDSHEMKWVPYERVADTVTIPDDAMAWKYFSKGGFASIDEGILINSDSFSGLSSEEAKSKITKFVGGKLVTKYKMRDAIFARQRYWGEPIPLIHDKKTGLIREVPLSKLPLKLPAVKSYTPTGTGESPLAGVASWVKAGYETNTMPGWAGSSWYFLRYMDPKNSKALASTGALKYWRDVDMYVGGTEHNTGHLMYARFWHKVLHDLGIVPTDEPFRALRHQGMIGGADGRKMSKRWGNVVNPDDVVATYGADSLRVFEMFLGPFDAALPWSTDGIVGSRRFVEKVWKIGSKVKSQNSKLKSNIAIQKTIHKTVKKVTEDIQGFNFNTAISAMMICANEMEKGTVAKKDFMMFLQVLAPFASFVTEELWSELGEKGSIHTSAWPKYDPKLIVDDEITMGIQINGKVRDEITIPKDAAELEVKTLVLARPKVREWIAGKEIKKFIYVPGRIISVVAP